ncbi:MAG: hypothetical protein AB1555_16325 [Nitrospirota bacterium]
MAHKVSADRIVIPRWTIKRYPRALVCPDCGSKWCASGPIGVKSSFAPAA